MRKVGPEFPQDPPRSVEDEITLAPSARPAEQLKPRRPGAGGEIERLVTGQKDPRSSLDGVGIRHARPQQVHRLHFKRRHHPIPSHRVSLPTGNIAEPGGICISEDAFRQVRGKVEVEFDEIGEQTLKNIARPGCASIAPSLGAPP
jgi:hypothetical protein